MSSTSSVVVPCDVSPGIFSGERQFKIKRSEAEEYVGTASILHFSTKGGKSAKDLGYTEKQGGIKAIKLKDLADGQVLVYLPDGSVIPVTGAQIEEER